MLQNYVLLREFLPRDQKVFCSLQEDQDVGQFVDWLPRTRYQAEVAFWDALEQQVMPIRSRFFYAVEVDSIVAGSVGFTLLSGGSADCGWFLRKNFWGKGIGTKAVALLVEDAFAKGISKLRASARSQNIGSIRVAEKCGFQRLGEKNGRVFFEVIDNRKICPAVS
jgi:ribosomal-protein-alanine N-acetyltransferase